MAELETLIVTLTAETSELRAQLKGAQVSLEKSTQSMSKAITSFSKDGAKNTSFFQNAWASMVGFVGGQFATRAIDSAIGLFTGLFDTLIKDGIKAAAESEVAMNNLLGSLSRSGNILTTSRNDWDAFAQSIQDTTTVGDDAVLTVATMIENITGLSEEALKPATRTTIDFAEAMNLDLASAAQIVGKALEGNVGALKRYGISVEEGSTKAETMANVLEKLNEKFGGAAASKLNTYEGSIKAISNSFEDVTKVFGKSVTQNPAVISAFNGLNKLLKDIGRELEKAAPAFKVFIADALKPAAQAFNVIAQGALFFVSQMNAIKLGAAVSELESLEEAQSKVQKSLEAIEKNGSGRSGIFTFDEKAVGALTEQNNALEARITKQREVVASALDGTTKMDEALTSISNAVTGFTDSVVTFDTTKASVENLGKSFGGATNNVIKLTDEQQKHLDLAKEYTTTILDQAGTIEGSYQNQLDQYINLKNQQVITDEEFNQIQLDLLAEKQAKELSLFDDGLKAKKMSESDAADARSVLLAKQDVETGKVLKAKKDKEDKDREDHIKGAQDMFGNLATLTSTGNKTLGAIGKAAAIGQATVSTYVAANKAMEAGPFLGPIFAAAAIVAGLVNVAKISSTPLATGIDSVPGMGSSDNFPAMLAPGERVVPTKTNEDLTDFLKGQQNQGPSIAVTVIMNDVFTSDPREMGLKIINVINETASSNGIKILGSSVT